MCVQSGPSDRVLIAVGGALANVGLVTDYEQSVPLLSQRERGGACANILVTFSFVQIFLFARVTVIKCMFQSLGVML